MLYNTLPLSGESPTWRCDVLAAVLAQAGHHHSGPYTVLSPRLLKTLGVNTRESQIILWLFGAQLVTPRLHIWLTTLSKCSAIAALLAGREARWADMVRGVMPIAYCKLPKLPGGRRRKQTSTSSHISMALLKAPGFSDEDSDLYNVEAKEGFTQIFLEK